MGNKFVYIVMLCSAFACWIYFQNPEKPPSGQMISHNADEGLGFVLYDQTSMSFKKGDRLTFHTASGSSLSGVYISSKPWFHRTMVKVKLARNPVNDGAPTSLQNPL